MSAESPSNQSDHCLSAPRRRWLERGLPLAVVVILLLPHFMTIRPWSLTFKLGYIISGDEPHYLLLIGSLVEDGDVDLSNNYDAVHAGQTWNAGRFCRNDRKLDHHTYLMIDRQRVPWSSIYQLTRPGSMELITDPYNRRYRPTQPGATPIEPGTPEYSVHQPGVAFLLAPVTFWARGTRFIEPVALLCSALATLIAFFYFRNILRLLRTEESLVNRISAVTFLGTSIWFYSRSLFLESHLLMCICATYYYALSRRLPLMAGCYSAIAIQLKAYYLLAFVPVGIELLWRKEFRYLRWYALPVGLSGLVFLLENHYFFGDYFTGSQPYVVGSFLEGAVGHWLSRSSGILATSPAALVAILCWPDFIRKYPRQATLLGGAFSINFAIMSFYAVWWGATCYGPRYMTPFLPFLFASLAAAPQWLRIRSWKGLLFWVLAGVSIVNNASAAFYYAHFWETPPVSVQAIDWFYRL